MAETAPKSRADDARVTRTRAALHAALLALVRRMPFAEVTVAAIVAEAGVGYATFFRHYRTREALLAAIAQDFIVDLLARMAPLVRADDTAAAARALIDFVAANRAICHALLIGAGDEMRRDITARSVAGAAAIAMPAGRVPRDLAVTHTVGAGLTIVAWWLEHPGALTAQEAAETLDRLVLRPVAH